MLRDDPKRGYCTSVYVSLDCRFQNSQNMAASQDEELFFGENIDKSLFEESMVQIAQRLRRQGKSVFDLQAAKNEMSPEKDKYVFITIFKGHASIVVVDKELFDTLLFPPIWGQMIDGPNVSFRDDSEAARRMATTIPLQQYHICLDDSETKYILARNMYYMPWLKKARSFFVGETAMAYLYLQLLCLTVVPSKYRLIIDDCLEFAKRFAREIAVKENGLRETEVRVLYRTLAVSEDYTSATVEQASRNNPRSGFTAAISYFTSFRLERLLLALVSVMVAIVLFRFFAFK